MNINIPGASFQRILNKLTDPYSHEAVQIRHPDVTDLHQLIFPLLLLRETLLFLSLLELLEGLRGQIQLELGQASQSRLRCIRLMVVILTFQVLLDLFSDEECHCCIFFRNIV